MQNNNFFCRLTSAIESCHTYQNFFLHTGLILQTLGLATLAVLYPLENPFYTVGILTFEGGVLLSSLTFFVIRHRSLIIIFVLALVALSIQFFGLSAPEEYAGSIIIGGIWLICTLAALMAGGIGFVLKLPWFFLLLLFAFPVIPLMNFFCKVNHVFNAVGFSSLFLVQLFLTGKKLQQPLP